MANEQARALRRRMTPQEVKLWVRLRELRPQGYHFRRQAPRAGAIVDFVCLRRKLVVEVDGGRHSFDRQAAADRERERRLADRGFRTIRFWNAEVDANLDSVVETIWHALQEAADAAARWFLPARGGRRRARQRPPAWGGTTVLRPQAQGFRPTPVAPAGATRPPLAGRDLTAALNLLRRAHR